MMSRWSRCDDQIILQLIVLIGWTVHYIVYIGGYWIVYYTYLKNKMGENVSGLEIRDGNCHGIVLYF